MPFLLLIISLGMSGLSYAFCGWLGSIMWRWFAVGIFHLPPLGAAQSVGVFLLLGFFMPTVHPMADADEDRARRIAHDLVYGFVYPAMLFGYAWVLKEFFL